MAGAETCSKAFGGLKRHTVSMRGGPSAFCADTMAVDSKFSTKNNPIPKASIHYVNTVW